jgi:hypothetical protein
MQMGISFIRRNFVVESSYQDIPNNNLKIRVVNYEIPVNVTYYVPLTPRLLLCNTLGVAVNFLPTALLSFDENLALGTARNAWAVPSFPVHIGLEYRTDKAGYFYGGLAYHLFAFPMYRTEVVYAYNRPEQTIVETKIRGDYFSIMLRYFFPVNQSGKGN